MNCVHSFFQVFKKKIFFSDPVDGTNVIIHKLLCQPAHKKSVKFKYSFLKLLKHLYVLIFLYIYAKA